tara:strand:- start:2541 stop:3500 length:960 start_codon:yes stop_codon:yes gene_type:complete
MRAAQLTSPKTLEIIETEVPIPNEDEILVKLETISVCGSDLRKYDAVLPEEEYPLEIGKPNHECIGIVVESKSNLYKEGDRVIVLASKSDGLKEYMTEHETNAVLVPNYGDPAVWLMCQPMGTVLFSCQETGSFLGKNVAILGQGPIGLNFTSLVAAGGAKNVITTDLLDNRLEVSKNIGATHTINPSKSNPLQVVEEITDGELVDIVIEAAGEESTLNQCFDLVKRQGFVTLFGVQWNDNLNLEIGTMFDKQIKLIATSSARSGRRNIAVEQTISLVDQNRLSLDHLITHRKTFDEVQEAYDMYSDKTENCLKVVMEF